ncbi:UNVERIFIED_CONTAM: U-box domain-containing protein 52 [Sesamum radiatum]|uniref:RING-type E3 ubiquitin transferase n=1 Tax=Sesamum radiatum TaxID=300843 RepID=A0AAW2JWJ1_SESRA
MGAYGAVYQCSFQHTTAAVKILHAKEASRNKQFQQELEILSQIRHPHLLILLGACPDHGCLVYEFMENGSLEDRLFRKNNTPPLLWFDRFRIAWEVASALVFLHNSKPKAIIHRDLKPANILLDRNNWAHCAISTLSTKEQELFPSVRRYAFGMVILQLLTAKPAIALAHEVELAVENDRLMEVLDPEAGPWPVEETNDLVLIALKCTELRRRDRPDLRDEVLPVLEKMKDNAETARNSRLISHHHLRTTSNVPFSSCKWLTSNSARWTCEQLKKLKQIQNGKQNRANIDGLNGLRPSMVSFVVGIAINCGKRSKYVIRWALENLIPDGGPEQVCFKLIHVFPEITTVPTPMGTGMPISQVRNDVAAAFRKEVEWQTSERILPYKMLCIRKKVQAEIVQIESDDIVNAIAKEIAKCNIKKLVIGASSTGGLFSRKIVSSAPSDPEAVSSTRDDTSHTGRFSNYSTSSSEPAWKVQESTVSYPSLPPLSPNKQFQSVSAVHHSVTDRLRNSTSSRTFSYDIGEEEDDGISMSSGSGEYRPRARTIKNGTETGTGNLNDLYQQLFEETIRLEEMNLKEEEAKEIAEQEKARYEDAKREAEYAKECAEKETALRIAAEKKAICEVKAKDKLAFAAPVHHYQEFTWEEITTATSSFSNDLRVGMGSYGTVYKCTLRHTAAAVKILHSMATNRSKQFQQELEILSKIRHPNLLTLLGACPERGCLVYEYMENGSLEERLFRKNNSPPIPWFVSKHTARPKLVSKVGDVGLSTMLHPDTSNTATLYKDTSPVGTLCYIDPEYQRTGLVSPKSDVYAFGMVVLQLLTAKPAIALARTVEMAIDDDCLDRVLDAEAGQWPAEETKELAILALRCTELRHRDRPDLRNQILPALEKLKMVADKARDLATSPPTGPPSHFICPILKVVMNDPCVAADGYSYDRKAIEEWVEENDTSPITSMPLPNKSLIPNYTLLSAITHWKSGQC